MELSVEHFGGHVLGRGKDVLVGGAAARRIAHSGTLAQDAPASMYGRTAAKSPFIVNPDLGFE